MVHFNYWWLLRKLVRNFNGQLEYSIFVERVFGSDQLQIYSVFAFEARLAEI